MILEVHGAGFHNKGGELMLRTTVAELGRRLPDATFAVDPTVGSYKQRCHLGLRQIIPPRGWMGNRRFRYLLSAQRMLGPLLTTNPLHKLADIYGGITVDSIDALVDVSGFAFTDQWGSAPIQDFARLARAYCKKNKPVIMLPQAFGPFEKRTTGEAMKKIAGCSKKIYARDDISLQHVRSVVSGAKHIEKAPDITLFYPGMIESVRSSKDASYSCIIPNVRMLDQGGAEWGDLYEDMLIHIGDMLFGSGENICLLIHDTSGKDKAIAERVQKAMRARPDIIQKEDPIALKDFIAESRLVVTSRYHGAVAAFSKAVPSICMGWAHKYKMLYQDFGCSDCMLDPGTSYESLDHKLSRLLDVEANNRVRSCIYDKLLIMNKKVQAMWGSIAHAVEV